MRFKKGSKAFGLNANCNQKGFTVIELLIVIFILGMLAALVIASLSVFNRSQTVDGVAKAIDAMINDARSRSVASVEDSSYGMYFDANSAVLFKGTSYDSNDPANEVYALPSTVAINSINLTGGATALYFEKITGTASRSGSITFEHTQDASQTRTIVISSTGLSDIQ